MKNEEKSSVHSQLAKLSLAHNRLSIPEANELCSIIAFPRPPSVPVIGRRLSSESMITVKGNEWEKMPFPVQLTQKKIRRSSMGLTSRSGSTLKLKQKSEPKPLPQRSPKVKQKVLIKNKSHKMSLRKKEIIGTKVKKRAKKIEESPKNPKALRSLIIKSIKRQKKSKKHKESSERSENFQKQIKKKYIQRLDQVTREENLMKFKHKSFRPKFPWGADEMRIKELSSKPKTLDYSEKPALTPSKKLKKSSSSTHYVSLLDLPQSKPKKVSRPDIKLYLKTQRRLRKKSSERDQEHRIERESRRLSQLKHLDLITRQGINKKLHRKKKLLKQKISEIEFKSLETSEKLRSVSLDSKERFAAIESSELLDSQKDSRKDSGEAFNRVLVKKSPEKLIEPVERPKEKNLLELKQKNAQKQEELNNRFATIRDKLKQLSPDPYLCAVVKIQAWTRGMLVRRALKQHLSALNRSNFSDSNSWMYKKQYPDNTSSFNEEDEEVKKILKVFSHKLDSFDGSFKDLEALKEVNDKEPAFDCREIDRQLENDLKNLKDLELESKRLRELLPIEAFGLQNDLLFKADIKIADFEASPRNSLNRINERPNEKKPGTRNRLMKIEAPIVEFCTKDENTKELKETTDNTAQEPSANLFLDHDSPSISSSSPHFAREFFIQSSCSFSPEVQQPFIAADARSPPGKIGQFSSVVWIDEVAMPESCSLEEIFVSSAINDLEEFVFCEALDEFCEITAESLVEAAESLIYSLISTELRQFREEFLNKMNEESIQLVISSMISEDSSRVLQKVNSFQPQDPMELLSLMQESEIGSILINYSFESVLNPMTLFKFFTENPQHLCIFYKLLFDCTNQCLDTLTPRSELPWSCKKSVPNRFSTIESVITKVKALIISWNSVKTGKVVNADTFIAAGITEDSINKCREQQILRRLSQESLETEPNWIDYAFEETQMELDIADMALESLVEELFDMISL